MLRVNNVGFHRGCLRSWHFSCAPSILLLKSFLDFFFILYAQIVITEHQVSVKKCPSYLSDNPRHLGTYEVYEPSNTPQYSLFAPKNNSEIKKDISCFPYHSHCFQNYVRFLPLHKPQKKHSGDTSRISLSLLSSVLKVASSVGRVC